MSFEKSVYIERFTKRSVSEDSWAENLATNALVNAFEQARQAEIAQMIKKYQLEESNITPTYTISPRARAVNWGVDFDEEHVFFGIDCFFCVKRVDISPPPFISAIFHVDTEEDKVIFEDIGDLPQEQTTGNERTKRYDILGLLSEHHEKFEDTDELLTDFKIQYLELCKSGRNYARKSN